jgi:hypothetical protein
MGGREELQECGGAECAFERFAGEPANLIRQCSGRKFYKDLTARKAPTVDSALLNSLESLPETKLCC